MGDGIGAGAGTSARVRAPVPARDLSACPGGGQDEAGAAIGRVITLDIPITLPPINVLMRLHWRKRARMLSQTAMLLRSAINRMPESVRAGWPIAACTIRIERSSRREPDPDAIDSTAKLILDALQPKSKRHPFGLGVIAEDNRKCLRDLRVVHVPRAVQRSVVTITEVAE